MKNILYMSDYSDIGGGENSLFQIIKYQKKANLLNPFYASIRSGELNRLIEKENIPVKIFRTRQRIGWIKILPLFNPVLMVKLGLFLVVNRIDFIHVNTTGVCLANCFLVAKLLGKPLFLTCHGKWEKPYGIRGMVLGLFLEKIFFVSDYVKSISTYKNGVTTYLPYESKTANIKLVNELKIKYKNAGTIICAVIGRYQPVKNQYQFVEYMDKYLDLYKEIKIKILLIGSTKFDKKWTKYELEVRHRIRKSKYRDSYICIPSVSEIECYYEIIDLVIIPSLFETFSMVALESMARKKIVLATKNGGPAELITDSVSGFLFDPNSCDDFLEKIKLALINRKDIAENAYARSLIFLPEIIVKNMNSYYLGMHLTPAIK